MADFPILQMLRYNADNLAAMRHDAIGAGAHQTDTATAIDEANLTFRHFAAKFLGKRDKIRVGSAG
jgi:hypothetical protein